VGSRKTLWGVQGLGDHPADGIMGTDLSDQKYRGAVETIAANCGAEAKALVAGDPERFSDKKVRALAGTSPDYQRHVIGRAAAGDKSPFRLIAAATLVYDTVRFGEVTSRLHRAVGMVRKEAALMARAVKGGLVPDRLADRMLTLDLVAEQASRLRELLTGTETVAASGAVTSRSREADTAPIDKLHAAGGLGLVAKNVRNVAALRSEHRPTPGQKETALRLTAEALDFAVAARDAARRAFGRADAACRVRPARTPVRRVITHAKPDGDAVAAAWLAERFMFAGEPVEVLFVPRGRVLGAYRAGDCLVDVGNTHDPDHLFFDHKEPAFPDRHDSCAARLVWDRLVKLGRPVRHLKPLVDVVFAGDSPRARVGFKDEYAESERRGFHKALADARRVEVTDAGRPPAGFGLDPGIGAAANTAKPADADVYRAVRRWLDNYHRRMLTRAS
jgi:hypothetical protein